ncbi:hypothetical protein GE061_003823 [Apolygus lucorum]|uniref:Uncharacterized protein n=1 Tax=Apolygus lucorum TaxID=248454 RepID=A0A8S9X4J0_APOLU|nr:hypothetical protein GE061_003823 [Apolygus lucorum]
MPFLTFTTSALQAGEELMTRVLMKKEQEQVEAPGLLKQGFEYLAQNLPLGTCLQVLLLLEFEEQSPGYLPLGPDVEEKR